ncbi:hypothetical protein GC194_11995 [bacterium]|nr:hypothetical protein [bacterium]
MSKQSNFKVNAFFFYLAFAGWLLAVATNLLAWLGINVADYVPFIWGLHIGIFVVWIPTVLFLKRNEKINEQLESVANTTFKGRMEYYKILFEHTPKWITIAAVVGLAYAVINFALFMLQMDGSSPVEENGVFSLQNHGKFIRLISENEYHRYHALEIRGFSGHWIAFYGVATAVLFRFTPMAKRKLETIIS